MKDWLCLNCQLYIDLDKSGRCENCGSDAVDSAHRPVKPLIKKLPKLIPPENARMV
jgi:hypothetical protein